MVAQRVLRHRSTAGVADTVLPRLFISVKCRGHGQQSPFQCLLFSRTSVSTSLCVGPVTWLSLVSRALVDWFRADFRVCLASAFKVFLDEPAAKVYLLDNFASDAECKALTDRATPHLQVCDMDVGHTVVLLRLRFLRVYRIFTHV